MVRDRQGRDGPRTRVWRARARKERWQEAESTYLTPGVSSCSVMACKYVRVLNHMTRACVCRQSVHTFSALAQAAGKQAGRRERR